MSNAPYSELYCDVCDEHHDSPHTVASHQRAAAKAESKYGISI